MDLGESENFSGVTMVNLSCVRKLSHLPLCLILLEQFQEVNRSKFLPITQDVFAEIKLDFDATKESFLDCGNIFQNISSPVFVTRRELR